MLFQKPLERSVASRSEHGARPAQPMGGFLGRNGCGGGGYFFHGLKKKEPNRGTCWGRNNMKEELPIACLLKIAHHLTTEVLVVD